jgi:hypothetical protein
LSPSSSGAAPDLALQISVASPLDERLKEFKPYIIQVEKGKRFRSATSLGYKIID